jgi:uncharacterized protein YbaR (Trm112 family)
MTEEKENRVVTCPTCKHYLYVHNGRYHLCMKFKKPSMYDLLKGEIFVYDYCDNHNVVCDCADHEALITLQEKIGRLLQNIKWWFSILLIVFVV